jgi:hypothetical protein
MFLKSLDCHTELLTKENNQTGFITRVILACLGKKEDKTVDGKRL